MVKKNLGITEPDLSDYATKKDVENAVSSIPTPDVSGQINEHNNDESAHPYIQNELEKVNNSIPTSVSQLNNDSNFVTEDTVSELIRVEFEKLPEQDVSGQISAALVDYVKKVEGKGLSTNDFTNELKTKLEGITPYDPSELEAEIGKLETAINTLVGGNASNAIESFNEIIAFLKNVSDTESLSGIIAGINARIAEVEGKIPTKVSELENDKNYLTEHQSLSHLATKNELNTKQDKIEDLDAIREGASRTIPTKTSELTNDSGFLTEHQDISHLATKDELKSKQDVISDLANIREGASKGSTAIQEEQYKGTIAAVDTDESVDDPNIPSGSYDDTEIKAQIEVLASEVEGKQETLVSGQNIKTINGKSLLGEGNIEIERGDSYDDTELKNQITDLASEVSKKADEAETASKLSELGSKVKSENTNSEGDIASTKLVWKNFITEKKNNNRNIFSSWDSSGQVELEFFVLSLKIESKNNNTDERKEYYYNNLRLTEVQVTHNQVGFFIKNPKDEWVLYNSYITKESGVKRYVLTYSYYSVELILNWDYAPQTRIYGDGVQLPFEGKYLVNYDKPLSYLLYSELEDTTPTTTSLDNIFFKVFNFQDEKVVDVISEKGNFSVSYDNGLRFVAEGYTGNYEANTPQLERIAKFLTHGHKYALFYDVEFTDNILFHTSDAFEVLFIKYAQLLSFNIGSEYTYVSKNRVFGVSFSQAPQDPNVEVHNYFIRFKKYNNTHTTSKILDVKFNQLMLVDVSDSILKDKTERELRALFMQTGTFEKIVLVNNTTDTKFNSLYQGLNLRSLGDSLPETVSFQPYIAQSFGMKYDSNVELTTENIVWNGENVTRWRSVYGGTRVAPITISNGDTGKAESSIYMRAKSLKYNAPDVLLILGGYNDTIAGKPYINGGTSVQPDDYGLTDEPYLGGEIDLVTNPQAEVPSFGACYRGMIENILKDVPWCRIVLCGVPRGSGETGKYGTDLDWNNKKNAVIERIAKEYGFPYVNLADVYGVNKYNYDWLTKDELHFSEFGGRRVAMEIIAQAF